MYTKKTRNLINLPIKYDKMSPVDKDLLESAKNHNINNVKKAIDNGANVNAQNKYGQTPLHLAITLPETNCGFTSCDIKIIKLLLSQKNIDVNIQDTDGWTPLHLAVFNENYKAIELLLSKNIDINIQENKYQQTPFDFAKDNMLIVDMFEEHNIEKTNQALSNQPSLNL